jgi:NAD(P)-dependent dehydrogenase (short-subunit alcohol dehydrogenase family)
MAMGDYGVLLKEMMARGGAVAEDPFDMSGKVALVTGAGTGIGAAIAKLFAAKGARLVLAGRKIGPLETVADEVRKRGGDVITVPTDVRDADACEALVEAARARYGRLNFLINNAGGSRTKDYASWTLKDYDDMLALNLRSVWVLTRAAATLMEAGDAVVNISSGASLHPVPHSAPYGVAKAGVNNLTSVMSVDLAAKGIRVNCIAPGTIMSEGFLRAMERMELDPSIAGGQNPTGRPGMPDEIAWPVLFFCSSASGFITGQTIYAGGGPVGVYERPEPR